ncbi:hypothetical protein [Pseudosulfitobacter sp. DSM 107133]|jgi:undecaprenyl-diphosphatase|uniref:hypothetical protein n=1 Tax=Pseudosulfitobacter sp. DSM 107133 TaxID=2883100 RepID=UPI000DF1D8D0|nr:hypothetical protein [Pseudosulfitobacter sp. DSM 107133]UOA26055.1 hypothetical protein DSM107133_00746 [Pseudosulfitobacter sp. DSM 107133]
MPFPAAIAVLFRRAETVTLIVILFIAAALWTFVAIAAEMLEGDLHAFDEAALLALRSPGNTAHPIGAGFL